MATTFTVEVDWTKTGTWVDETSRTRRVKCWAGFKAPGDPVAAVGRCVLTLDNSAQRFSPGNTAGALFGNLLPMRPVRVKATSGSTWTLFRGFIDRILPDVGKYGGQECVLECVDALAILAAQRASVVYAASKTVKDTVIALVESVYAPPAEDIVDNGDLVAHYGRPGDPKTSTLMALCARCATPTRAGSAWRGMARRPTRFGNGCKTLASCQRSSRA